MDSNTEVRSISAYLEQLRKKELGFFDIPEEYRSNSNANQGLKIAKQSALFGMLADLVGYISP